MHIDWAPRGHVTRVVVVDALAVKFAAAMTVKMYDLRGYEYINYDKIIILS